MEEQALLIAVPLRHLEAAAATGTTSVTLPAGGPGDLDAAAAGLPLIVMATDAGESEVPAATWSATFVRWVPYDLGSPWPDGLPPTWTEEYAVPEPPPAPAAVDDGEGDDYDELDQDDELDLEDEDDGDDGDDDELGPQSFLEVTELRPLPRSDWLFANELVGKQARGGRSYRPRVPIIVDLPD